MPTPFYKKQKGVGVFSSPICCQDSKSRPDLFSHSAIQKRNNLPTGTGCGGREITVTGSACDVLLNCPSHSLRIVCIGRNVIKIGFASRRRASRRFPHIFHSHGSGTIGVCAKGGTGHKPLFSGPQSRLIEVIDGFNICKRIRCCRLRRAVSAPQESQNLRLAASRAGGECGLTGAAGDVFFNRPLYCVRKVVACLYISKIPLENI